MPIRMLMGLLVANAIWSAHPVMGKWTLEDFSPIHVAWLRYSSALLAYLIYSAISRGKMFFRPSTPHQTLLVLLLGVLPFCFGPMLQLSGLVHSQATDNALIIAMEPLITLLMARVFLGERAKRQDLMAFGLALLGFLLLSRWTSIGELSENGRAALVGDLLMLLSLVGEASYTVIGRNLSQRFPPTPVFGTAIFGGVIFLTLWTGLSASGFPRLSQFHWRSLVGILWLGPLGTMAVYLYWIRALAHAPVAGMVLTLFLQPLLGAVLGYVLLGERLGAVQLLGAALIFLAVFGQAVTTRRTKKTD